MSAPTCRELLDKIAPCGVEKECSCDTCTLSARAEKMLALHVSTGDAASPSGMSCIECGMHWPCKTRRILDGLDEEGYDAAGE